MKMINNYSLKEFHTFGIDSKAKLFTSIESKQDFDQLIETPEFKENPVVFLGEGSNIIFSSDYNGFVIQNNLKGIEIVSQTDQTVTLKVASGEIWHDFVLYCIEKEWGGIENMSLIPGTVGASPIQNIGAYGVEIKDVLNQVEFFDFKENRWIILEKENCLFGYRDSIFKQKERGSFFIGSITLTLTKEGHHTIKTHYGDILKTLVKNKVNKPSIKDVSNAVIDIRQSKLPDPKILGNSGSFFKNPIISKNEFNTFNSKHPEAPFYPLENDTFKIPAGWLIEQSGWKGKQIGNVGSHKKQALVLVNYGNALGKEIKELYQAIQEDVKSKFGIVITPEVNIL